MAHEIETGGLALGAMVGVAVLRKFLPKVPKTLLPWVSALIAALGQLALLQGHWDTKSIIDAATYGLAASGLWSGGGKLVSAKAKRVVRRVTGGLKKADDDKSPS